MRVEHFRKATLYCGDCREILPELAGGGGGHSDGSPVWDLISDRAAQGNGHARHAGK